MTIGEKIKTLREKHGYSQAELAQLVGVSKQAIGKYEKGIVDNLPLNRVQQLAVIFGCTPEYLMGWEEQEKAAPSEKELLIAEIIKHLETLSPEQMRQVIQYAQFLKSTQG